MKKEDLRVEEERAGTMANASGRVRITHLPTGKWVEANWGSGEVCRSLITAKELALHDLAKLVDPHKKTHCQMFEEWWAEDDSTQAFQGPRSKKWWEFIKSGTHSQMDLAREAFMSGIRVGRAER